jgi:hypothetical protein
VRRHGLEIFGLLVVLLVAAYLRIGWPDVIEFKRDEANLSLLALDFATGKSFPLLGITSSVGVPNAPFNVYILAIPYLFSSNPVLATQFIGLLNVFAIGLTYGLLRRYTGYKIALVMCFMFAVSPWGVIFSRKIWAQNMLPLFVLLTLITGIWAFIDKKHWAKMLHFPFLAILGQIHYGAFVMIPAYVILWVIGGRSLLSRYTVIGIVFAGLLCLPYAIGLYQGGFFSIETLTGASNRVDIVEETSSNVFTLTPIHEAGVLIAGTDIHSLAGTEKFKAYLDGVPHVYPLFGVLAYAVLISLLWLIAKIIRQRYERRAFDVVLCVWLIFPIVSFLIPWTTFYIHYLIPILPAAFIMLGLALSDMLEVKNTAKIIKQGGILIGGVGLICISLLQIGLFVNLLNFIYQNNTPNGFGTPIGYLIPLRDYVLAEAPNHVIGQFEGQAIGFDDEATIFAALFYDVPSIRFEDAQTRVFREENILLIADNDRYEKCFPRRPDEGCYSVTYRPAIENPLDVIVIFDNGVEILSYSWEEITQCLTVLWRINQPTDNYYSFAVHGFNQDGARQAVADGLSWLPEFWQIGDVVERVFCLTGDIVYIELGMYHLLSDNTYQGIKIQGTFDYALQISLTAN